MASRPSVALYKHSPSPWPGCAQHRHRLQRGRRVNPPRRAWPRVAPREADQAPGRPPPGQPLPVGLAPGRPPPSPRLQEPRPTSRPRTCRRRRGAGAFFFGFGEPLGGVSRQGGQGGGQLLRRRCGLGVRCRSWGHWIYRHWVTFPDAAAQPG